MTNVGLFDHFPCKKLSLRRLGAAEAPHLFGRAHSFGLRCSTNKATYLHKGEAHKVRAGALVCHVPPHTTFVTERLLAACFTQPGHRKALFLVPHLGWRMKG